MRRLPLSILSFRFPAPTLESLWCQRSLLSILSFRFRFLHEGGGFALQGWLSILSFRFFASAIKNIIRVSGEPLSILSFRFVLMINIPRLGVGISFQFYPLDSATLSTNWWTNKSDTLSILSFRFAQVVDRILTTPLLFTFNSIL